MFSEQCSFLHREADLQPNKRPKKGGKGSVGLNKEMQNNWVAFMVLESFFSGRAPNSWDPSGLCNFRKVRCIFFNSGKKMSIARCGSAHSSS